MGTFSSETVYLSVEPSYLSIYVKGARLLVQVYVGDSRDFTCLLDVGPVSPDGKTHQVVPNCKLFMKPWRQLPGTLQKHDEIKHHHCHNRLSDLFIKLITFNIKMIELYTCIEGHSYNWSGGCMWASCRVCACLTPKFHHMRVRSLQNDI